MWPTGMGCMSADGPVPQDLAGDAAQSVQMFSHWLTRQPQLKTLVSHEAPLYGPHVAEPSPKGGVAFLPAPNRTYAFIASGCP